VVATCTAGYLSRALTSSETDTVRGTRIVLNPSHGSRGGPRDQRHGRSARALYVCALRYCRPSALRRRFRWDRARNISVTGGVTFDQVSRITPSTAGSSRSVDRALPETASGHAQTARLPSSLAQGLRRRRHHVPVSYSRFDETNGDDAAGSRSRLLYGLVAERDLFRDRPQCAATGPGLHYRSPGRTLGAALSLPGVLLPNAGLPDEEGRYHETPIAWSGSLERVLTPGMLNIMGVCCGTTSEQTIRPDRLPRPPLTRPHRYAHQTIPSLGGSRCCPSRTIARPDRGRRAHHRDRQPALQELVIHGDLDQVGRGRPTSGSGRRQVLDVCLATPTATAHRHDGLRSRSCPQGEGPAHARHPPKQKNERPKPPCSSGPSKALPVKPYHQLYQPRGRRVAVSKCVPFIPPLRRRAVVVVSSTRTSTGMAHHRPQACHRRAERNASSPEVRPSRRKDLSFDPLSFRWAPRRSNYVLRGILERS